jgi:hypothetical protein
MVMLGLSLGLAACAVPQPPPGGPRDTTPPELVASTPAEGTVNVSTRTIRLEFSEYVERASLPRAVTLTPALDGPVTYDWGRRAVELTLPTALRDSTTYILTIDTELEDVRGVALRQPITLAFSTGPTIQQGRLAGQALDARTGTPVAGQDVWAYAALDSLPPRPLPERPAYRTQTGPDGRFSFEYLREQPYFVAVVDDRNRNLRPDASEAYGVPPRPVLRADSVRADTLAATWLIANPDTVRPAPQQVRSRSATRHIVRFSEPVRLQTRSPDGWLVVDSLQQRRRAVRAAYQPPGDRRAIALLTDSLASTPHLLRPAPTIVDSSDNAVRTDTLRFVPSARPDTLPVQFVDFVPAGVDSVVTLLPGQQPSVRFNQPIDSTRLQSVLSVVDSTGALRPFDASTTDGTTYRLRLRMPLAEGETVRLTVAPAVRPTSDTTAVQRVQRISRRQLGGVSGVVAPADTNRTVLVELYETEADSLVATVAAGPDGTFQFSGLPEGTYRFRAFIDRDADRRWNAGTLVPYRGAERAAWADAPSWRARWDTALADTLRIPTVD